MAITVRELVTKLGFKTDKKSVSSTEATLGKIKKAVTVLAGVLVTGKVVQGINALVQETAALGDGIDKVSSKLGINAQALQELRFAAEQTGVSTNTMDMALQRFTRRAAEAAKGTGEAKAALEEMNVRLKDSNGQLRPTEDLLGDVAEAMGRTKNDGDRLRLAFKLFDSEGAALVNTLKGGRGALEALRQTARDTGGVLDAELIAASAELTDTQNELKLTIQGVRNVIAKNLIPSMVAGARTLINFVKANRELIRTRLTAFLQKAVEVLGRLSRFFVDVADSTVAWFESLTPVQKGLLKISAIALGLVAILLLPGGAILLLAALVVALLDDFLTWREGGVSVIGDLIGSLDDLTAQFPGLFDFLETSALLWEAFTARASAAMDTLALFVGEIMQVGIVDAIASNLDAIGQFFVDAFDGITEAIAVAVEFWAELLFGWGDGARSVFEFFADAVRLNISIAISALQLMGKIGTGIFDGLKAVFEAAFDFILERWERLKRIAATAGKIADRVSSFFGGEGDEGGAARPAAGGGAPIASVLAAPGVRALAGGPTAAAGLHPTPGAAPGGAARGGVSVQNSNQFKIDIQAAPGMSEERVGEIAAQAVVEGVDETMRQSLEDFTLDFATEG